MERDAAGSARIQKGDSNRKEYRKKMNTKMLGAAVLAVAASILILTPRNSPAAEDGAALFKSKCAVCHGPNAEGKPALKAPSLVSDEAKKKSDEELTDMVANGGK